MAILRAMPSTKTEDAVTIADADVDELLLHFRFLQRIEITAAIVRVGPSRSAVHEELARVQARRVELAADILRRQR